MVQLNVKVMISPSYKVALPCFGDVAHFERNLLLPYMVYFQLVKWIMNSPKIRRCTAEEREGTIFTQPACSNHCGKGN